MDRSAPSTTPAGSALNRSATAARAASSTAALRRADGCAPMVVAPDRRKAVDTVIAPGVIIARITQLTWPVAIAVGPALTYGVVALAIIPLGALGIPWNGWTALAALAVVCAVATALQLALARYRDPEAEARGVSRWP